MIADTPIDQIAPIHARLVATQASGRTYPLEYRKTQLRKLYWAIRDNEHLAYKALKEDLGKPHFEAYMAEIGWMYKDILYALEQVDKWAAPEGQPDLETLYKLLMSPSIRKEPIGTVLIIGAFNYPIQLVLSPLVGAIAAGCTAIIKPSELCPKSAAFLEKIVSRLDSDAYGTVLGGIPETTALLDLKWDKIMYTGSTNVAKIVTKAASKHLTPCLLELGGLNPVIVTANADPTLAARRTLWTKVHNSGQICIAADYALVHASKEAAFTEACVATLKEFLPNGPKDAERMGRIVNERHFNRIKGLLENSKGKIIYGGTTDPSRYWIEPTIVKVNSLDDALLSEEIFGPILPFYVYKGTVDEAIKISNSICDTPLGFYAFSTDKQEQEYLLSHTRSGGASINDCMFHAALARLPFGGVGESGTGNYRGKASFDAFTHRRTTIVQPSWTEKQMRMRYMPYTPESAKQYKRANPIPEPNFDRNGNVVKRGIIATILSLGASNKKSAIIRYIIAIVGAYVLKNYWKK